jgi:signal peptidase I
MIGGLPGIVLFPVLAIAVATDTAVLSTVVAATIAAPFLYLAQAGWAASLAIRAGKDYRPRRFNRVPAYVGFAVATILLQQVLGLFAKEFVAESFRIPSTGMAPSLLVGDHVLAGKVGERNRAVQRGDVVVFRSLQDGQTKFVKRVLAIGGDVVAEIDGVLHVNGKPLDLHPIGRQTHADQAAGTWSTVELDVAEERMGERSYLVGRRAGPQPRGFGPVRVDDGTFFVVGDFRDNSMDSRHYGAVPERNLVGRVIGIFFSSGPESVRWQRIALAL